MLRIWVVAAALVGLLLHATLSEEKVRVTRAALVAEEPAPNVETEAAEDVFLELGPIFSLRDAHRQGLVELESRGGRLFLRNRSGQTVALNGGVVPEEGERPVLQVLQLRPGRALDLGRAEGGWNCRLLENSGKETPSDPNHSRRCLNAAVGRLRTEAHVLWTWSDRMRTLARRQQLVKRWEKARELYARLLDEVPHDRTSHRALKRVTAALEGAPGADVSIQRPGPERDAVIYEVRQRLDDAGRAEAQRRYPDAVKVYENTLELLRWVPADSDLPASTGEVQRFLDYARRFASETQNERALVRSTTKAPIMGNIPLIGKLFGRKDQTVVIAGSSGTYELQVHRGTTQPVRYLTVRDATLTVAKDRAGVTLDQVSDKANFTNVWVRGGTHSSMVWDSAPEVVTYTTGELTTNIAEYAGVTLGSNTLQVDDGSGWTGYLVDVRPEKNGDLAVVVDRNGTVIGTRSQPGNWQDAVKRLSTLNLVKGKVNWTLNVTKPVLANPEAAKKQPIPEVAYGVADLFQEAAVNEGEPAPKPLTIESLADLVRVTVTGDAKVTVQEMTLTVKAKAEIQERVAALLEDLRALRALRAKAPDAPPELPETTFERSEATRVWTPAQRGT